MRPLLSTLLELAGFALLVVGAGLVWPPLAALVGGAGLVIVGYAVDSPPTLDSDR